MSDTLAIVARYDFFDVPHGFAVWDGPDTLVFSSAFSDELDAFVPDYSVYRITGHTAEHAAIIAATEGVPIATVPVASVVFDPTRRATIARTNLPFLSVP